MPPNVRSGGPRLCVYWDCDETLFWSRDEHGGPTPRPKIKSILKRIKSRYADVRFYIYTKANLDYQMQRLDELGIRHYFEADGNIGNPNMETKSLRACKTQGNLTSIGPKILGRIDNSVNVLIDNDSHNFVGPPLFNVSVQDWWPSNANRPENYNYSPFVDDRGLGVIRQLDMVYSTCKTLMYLLKETIRKNAMIRRNVYRVIAGLNWNMIVDVGDRLAQVSEMESFVREMHLLTASSRV